ncbi:MAG TPA: argininosuccinate synthase [Proteobacteria bacterium]|nr:argininosuccinate synthase [bacterium BMS3Abin14]HDL53383.1 argininosuccinate synthase [Pseudomonadota bacterium]
MAKPVVKKVVLAYSGGLDTSVILTWLREEYGCEVVAFAADLGQGDEMDGIREKALNTGASEVFIEDLKEEFVRDFVFPALKGNAIYEGFYLLGTSIARPLIAKAQIDIARRLGADAVAHGATGKGNDQVRFELGYHALMPGITVIAPWREWDLGSRTSLMEYARKHDIPIPVTRDKPYSSDRNLLHISYEGGILEDPWQEPDESMFTLSVAPENAPETPEYITVDFEGGTPVAVDGKALSPANLLLHLNEAGGRHGVGRLDLVENRYVGMKSRGVYETPGGTILYYAHRAVESLTMDREVMHQRDSLTPRFSELIYNGYWFSPEMEWMLKCIEETQRDVTGTARIKLYKGSCRVVGRKAPHSLYMHDFATFEEESVFDQADSTGFIRVNALRLQISAMAKARDK